MNMASAGEIVTLGPRPTPRLWATAASTYPLLEGAEWEPDAFGVKRWLNGATFSPFGCEKAVGDTFDPCVERLTNYLETGACVDFYPFLMEVAMQAPTRVADVESMQEYVLAHSEISRSKFMAEQVERSEYNATNPSLASEAQVVANADQSLIGALMGVEEALADLLDGGAGMIHIPAHFLVALQSGGGLRYDADGRAYTATGHVIVADAGTLGVSPITSDVVVGETWIYGSGPVFAKWDDVVSFASPRAWENADIRRNRFLIDAEQYALALFEPCSVVAAVVDISDANIVENP